MPTWSGWMSQSAARSRTILRACRPSVTPSVEASSRLNAPLLRAAPAMNRKKSRQCARSSLGVSNVRYLRTKAVTPWAARAWATSRPSACIVRYRKPPPGAMTTAAPVAVPGSGLKTSSVGRVTFRTTSKRAPGNGLTTSTWVACSEPGAAPGQTSKVWAVAGNARAVARTTRRPRRGSMGDMGSRPRGDRMKGRIFLTLTAYPREISLCKRSNKS